MENKTVCIGASLGPGQDFEDPLMRVLRTVRRNRLTQSHTANENWHWVETLWPIRWPICSVSSWLSRRNKTLSQSKEALMVMVVAMAVVIEMMMMMPLCFNKDHF